VTWQLGPVRHTVTDEDPGTLAAAWQGGPRLQRRMPGYRALGFTRS
jgi:hypothetical protein